MDSDELKKVVGEIRKDYLLIPKGKIWTLIGGFLGVLTATGLICYGSAKAVLESTTAKQIEKELVELKAVAERQVQEITTMHQNYQLKLDTLSEFFGKVSILENNTAQLKSRTNNLEDRTVRLETNTVRLDGRYHIRIPGEGELVVRNGSRDNGAEMVFGRSRKESWQFVAD